MLYKEHVFQHFALHRPGISVRFWRTRLPPPAGNGQREPAGIGSRRRDVWRHPIFLPHALPRQV